VSASVLKFGFAGALADEKILEENENPLLLPPVSWIARANVFEVCKL
jgi:hypothetical protein